jgi:hypothetical protein
VSVVCRVGEEGGDFVYFSAAGKERHVFWSCVEFEGKRKSPMELDWRHVEGQTKHSTWKKKRILITVQSLTKQMSNIRKDTANLSTVMETRKLFQKTWCWK